MRLKAVLALALFVLVCWRKTRRQEYEIEPAPAPTWWSVTTISNDGKVSTRINKPETLSDVVSIY